MGKANKFTMNLITVRMLKYHPFFLKFCDNLAVLGYLTHNHDIFCGNFIKQALVTHPIIVVKKKFSHYMIAGLRTYELVSSTPEQIVECLQLDPKDEKEVEMYIISELIINHLYYGYRDPRQITDIYREIRKDEYSSMILDQCATVKGLVHLSQLLGKSYNTINETDRDKATPQ